MATPKKPSKSVPKAVKSLPKKSGKGAINVKGGAMGPGTQTEDDVYVGVRRR